MLISVFMEIVGENSRYALQEHLHLITAPLQVIWGTRDQVIGHLKKKNWRMLKADKLQLYCNSVLFPVPEVVDVSGAAVLAEALTGPCRVDVLENCGHSVVMERPRKTAKLIMEFIISQGTSGSTKKHT